MQYNFPEDETEIAESSALPLSGVRDLRKKALWPPAAVFINAGGARVLCEQYGFSKKEAEGVLRSKPSA